MEMVFAKVLCPSGNMLLQMIVAFEHMVRGWTAFTWKLLLGRGDVRFQLLRFICRKLGRDYWWRR
ncbi:MAG: hypothetical protein J6N18_02375 [Kiritimatiellae bacterium]|nr:hypothetical protein [Kiritimatiellia bacterium]